MNTHIYTLRKGIHHTTQSAHIEHMRSHVQVLFFSIEDNTPPFIHPSYQDHLQDTASHLFVDV